MQTRWVDEDGDDITDLLRLGVFTLFQKEGSNYISNGDSFVQVYSIPSSANQSQVYQFQEPQQFQPHVQPFQQPIEVNHSDEYINSQAQLPQYYYPEQQVTNVLQPSQPITTTTMSPYTYTSLPYTSAANPSQVYQFQAPQQSQSYVQTFEQQIQDNQLNDYINSQAIREQYFPEQQVMNELQPSTTGTISPYTYTSLPYTSAANQSQVYQFQEPQQSQFYVQTFEQRIPVSQPDDYINSQPVWPQYYSEQQVTNELQPSTTEAISSPYTYTSAPDASAPYIWTPDASATGQPAISSIVTTAFDAGLRETNQQENNNATPLPQDLRVRRQNKNIKKSESNYTRLPDDILVNVFGSAENLIKLAAEIINDRQTKCFYESFDKKSIFFISIYEMRELVDLRRDAELNIKQFKCLIDDDNLKNVISVSILTPAKETDTDAIAFLRNKVKRTIKPFPSAPYTWVLYTSASSQPAISSIVTTAFDAGLRETNQQENNNVTPLPQDLRLTQRIFGSLELYREFRMLAFINNQKSVPHNLYITKDGKLIIYPARLTRLIIRKIPPGFTVESYQDFSIIKVKENTEESAPIDKSKLPTMEKLVKKLRKIKGVMELNDKTITDISSEVNEFIGDVKPLKKDKVDDLFGHEGNYKHLKEQIANNVINPASRVYFSADNKSILIFCRVKEITDNILTIDKIVHLSFYLQKYEFTQDIVCLVATLRGQRPVDHFTYLFRQQGKEVITLAQVDSLIPQANQQIPATQILPTGRTITIQTEKEVEHSSNPYELGMPNWRGAVSDDAWFPIGEDVYGNPLSPLLFEGNNNNNYYKNNNNNNYGNNDNYNPSILQQIPATRIPPTGTTTTTTQTEEEVEHSSNPYDFGMANRSGAASDFWFPIGEDVYGNPLSPLLFASDNSNNNNNNYNPLARKHYLQREDYSDSKAKTKQQRQ